MKLPRFDAHDPYYLYAASNLGSFIGLLAYPALIEPTMGTQAQSAAWSAGYVLVAALIAACAAVAATTRTQPAITDTSAAEAPTWRKRVYWIAAAAVPSALSLGVTLHISTDVASAPMLWVVPLALYLATFVIAFSKRGDAVSKWSFLLHPFAVALLIVSYYASGNWLGSMTGILVGFFFSALICHHALAQSRPEAARLTEFYFFVSLGGVLGGAFAGLLAPVLFNNVYEYPLALAAACLFLPRSNAGADMPRLRDAAAAACLTLAVLIVFMLRLEPLDAVLAIGALAGASAMVAAGWSDSGRPAPMRYGFLAVAAATGCFAIWLASSRETVFVNSVIDGSLHLAMLQPWSGLLMALALLALGFCVHATLQRRREGEPIIGDITVGLAIPGVLLLLLLPLIGADLDSPMVLALGVVFSALAMLFNRGRPIVLAALVLVAFVMIFIDDARGGRIITQYRNFFGVLRTRVYDDQIASGVPELRVLLHGTTLHGAQLATPGLTRLPLTYYNPRTALGEATLAGLSTTEGAAHLALIGLGAGATACLARPTDELTIYEINPAVVELSMRPDGDFTYVSECAPNASLEVGDARLRIAEAADASFDVIVVDAFSSDAIPAHLLTREAMALYLSKTTQAGIVVLHLSNRNLALVSEAARVARDLGAPTLYRVSTPFDVADSPLYGGSAASVMIVAHSQAVLDSLPLQSTDWRAVPAPPGRSWSDDYINLPRALWENLIGAEECLVYPWFRRCGGTGAPP
jgi:hypothetical protein